MNRKIIILFVSVAFAFAVIGVIAAIWPTIASNYLVGIHQQDVTKSLAKWKTEYKTIETHHDAVRAAEMLAYIQNYYVPGEEYHSTPEIEAKLQSQRQETVAALVVSLREFTSKDFGTDSDKWIAFLKSFDAEEIVALEK